jgi:hypothetical protein
LEIKMNLNYTATARRRVGIGTPYHNICDLIDDKQKIVTFASALNIAARNIDKDSCDRWTITGNASSLQAAHDDRYLLYVATSSSRKWGAIKRKAKAFGWTVTQDGDDEGCIQLGLPDEKQARFLRSLLGMRKRQARWDIMANKTGVSLH